MEYVYEEDLKGLEDLKEFKIIENANDGWPTFERKDLTDVNICSSIESCELSREMEVEFRVL